ncbi:alpha/beta hydrolase [Enterococcus sp. LJL99]
MKRGAWGLGIVLILLLASGLFLHFNTYQPTAEALDQAKTAKIENKTLFFKGDSDKPTVLFYQGGLVENASYSIWAKKVSEAGYPVYLIKEPLNLAVLAPNKAEKIISTNHINSYVIGGHSLGGVMASRFAAEQKNDSSLKGVFFLASYPDKKGSLDSFSGEIVSITGSEDGVLNWEAYTEAKEYLPSQTAYKTIEGGNHAGFGSYGKQKKDKDASISNAIQQTQIADILIDWLAQIK